MPVKMVEGGIYRTRGGFIVGPLMKRDSSFRERGSLENYPWVITWPDGIETYSAAGHVLKGSANSADDLVDLILVGNDFIPFNGGPNPVPGASVTARMKAGYAASGSEHLQWDRVLAYRVDAPAIVKQSAHEQMGDAVRAWSQQPPQSAQAYEAPCGGMTSADLQSLTVAEARIRVLEAEKIEAKQANEVLAKTLAGEQCRCAELLGSNNKLLERARAAEKQRDDFFDMLRALTKITGQLAAKMDEDKANG